MLDEAMQGMKVHARAGSRHSVQKEPAVRGSARSRSPGGWRPPTTLQETGRKYSAPAGFCGGENLCTAECKNISQGHRSSERPTCPSRNMAKSSSTWRVVKSVKALSDGVAHDKPKLQQRKLAACHIKACGICG